jgi:hypothetical protein
VAAIYDAGRRTFPSNVLPSKDAAAVFRGGIDTNQ